MWVSMLCCQWLKWTELWEELNAWGAGAEAETTERRKENDKSLTSNPLTRHWTIPVWHREIERRKRELRNDPWCRVQHAWGRGTGVVVAMHPVPAVRLNLLQVSVHHNSYNAAPSTMLAQTHFSHYYESQQHWYMGLVLSHSLTPAHFSVWRHPTTGQAQWQKNPQKTAHVWLRTLRLTPRLEEVLGCGGEKDMTHCMDLHNIDKSHFCSPSKWTSTQSSHCLEEKKPFPCSQLAPPSPYQHHEQEYTPHLFSVTPSASYHSNPHSEVGHINGKQSMHSSNSLCFWQFPRHRTTAFPWSPCGGKAPSGDISSRTASLTPAGGMAHKWMEATSDHWCF